MSLYSSSSKGVQLLLTCCVFFFFLDIDECKAIVYPCKDQQHCTNLPGSYKCYSKYQWTSIEEVNTISTQGQWM